MKKNRFLTLAIIFVMSLLLAFSVFADTDKGVKTVSVLNEDGENLRLDFYITKGTAIAGYCSFKYDPSALTLLDAGSQPLPDPIPDYLSDGTTTYLRNVVVPNGDVVITNVGRDASSLINPESGYLFFAWTIPSDTEPADTKDGSVLIASANFSVNKSSEPNPDTIIVADSKHTDNVANWYPGIIVIDKDKNSYMYDGNESGKQYYASQFINNFKAAEPDVSEEVKEEESDENISSEETAEDIPDDKEDKTEEPSSPETEETEDNTDADVKESDKEDERAEDITGEETVEDEIQEDEEDIAEEDETYTPPMTLTPPSFAEVIDFTLSVEAEEDKAKIKWQKPESIEGLDSYSIIICDNDFRTVKKITGIFPVSTSYTIQDLCGGTLYNVYLIASKADAVYSSPVASFITKSAEGLTSAITLSVTYNKKGAHLFGLASEYVVYGSTVSKVPSVFSKNGKYFIGWSKDGVNVIDIENERIYANTIFYPVFADEEPAPNKKYISGYSDGTFKPSGNITRAEAATIISRISDAFDNTAEYAGRFSDCPKGMWYEKYVSFCSGMGYINGYENGTFKPSGNITRAEFATILVRVFGYDNLCGINVFSDISGHWAEGYISVLYSAGAILPDKDGNFRPDEKLTREDAVMMINRCLGIIPERALITENVKANGYRFSDVPQYSDSFFDIMSVVME